MGRPHSSFSQTGRRLRQMVVLEWDESVLRGSVVEVSERETVVLAAAESASAQLRQGVGECLAHLRQRVKHVPRDAVVVTCQAAAGIVELPVDPKHPRRYEQMTQLVRWELEGQIAHYLAARPLGAIMRTRGYLTRDQVRLVMEEVGRRLRERSVVAPVGQEIELNEPVSPAGAAIRFGDVAIEMGLATRRHVEECVQVQNAGQGAEADYVCGWVSQRDDGRDDGRRRWLGAAIERRVRDRWREACGAYALRLRGVYPLLGAGAAALPGETEQRQVVIEAQGGATALTRLQGAAIESIELSHAGDDKPAVEHCIELIGDELPEVIWLAGRDLDVEVVAHGLTERLAVAVRVIEPDLAPDDETLGASWSDWSSAVAAAHHVGRVASPGTAVRVAPRDPLPPLTQRPVAWWAAAVFILVVGGLCSEGWLVRTTAEAEATRETAHAALARLEESDAEIRQAQQEAEAIEQEISRVETQSNETQERVVFLTDDLADRRARAASVLAAVARATTEHVLVTRVTDVAGGETHVVAWATREQAAQQFVQKLAELLESVEMTPRIWAQTGRLGIEGYAVDVVLRSRATVEEPTEEEEH